MKSNLIYVALSVGLLSCIVFTVYLYRTEESAKQVVKDYWLLVLENKIEEANKLTASTETKEKPPMTRIGKSDGVNDCCMQDSILEFQMKLEKIINSQVLRENVGEEYNSPDGKVRFVIAPTIAMLVETTSKKGTKDNLAVCLGKSIKTDEWKIRRITYIEESDKLADRCRSY